MAKRVEEEAEGVVEGVEVDVPHWPGVWPASSVPSPPVAFASFVASYRLPLRCLGQHSQLQGQPGVCSLVVTAEGRRLASVEVDRVWHWAV